MDSSALAGLVGALVGAGTGAMTTWVTTRMSIRQDKERREHDTAEQRRVSLLDRRLIAHAALHESLLGLSEEIEWRGQDPDLQQLEEAAVIQENNGTPGAPDLGVLELIASEPARRAALRACIAARDYRHRTLVEANEDGLYAQLELEYFESLDHYRIAIQSEIGALTS